VQEARLASEIASPQRPEETFVNILSGSLLAKATIEEARLWGIGVGGDSVNDPVPSHPEPPVRVERTRELFAGFFGVGHRVADGAPGLFDYAELLQLLQQLGRYDDPVVPWHEELGFLAEGFLEGETFAAFDLGLGGLQRLLDLRFRKHLVDLYQLFELFLPLQ
jgi:hypothetical protein